MSLIRKHYSTAMQISMAMTFILLLTFKSSGGLQATEAEEPVFNGFNYAAYLWNQYSMPGSDESVEAMVATGANWMALVVTCYQENIDSTTIDCLSNKTPTDDELRKVIQQAKADGLKVMLRPLLNLSNDSEHWRGEIGKNFTFREWPKWFGAYTKFVVHYAALAEEQGADMFCMGTELVNTTTRSDDWVGNALKKGVLGNVRDAYTGPVIYAANHGKEEQQIDWWDKLDYIGVDAYYPLTNKDNPTVEELNEAWKPHIETLAAIAQEYDKQIIFTEIGYRSILGANKQPWVYSGDEEISMQEQLRCYKSVFDTFYGDDRPEWFAGLFWWLWRPDISRCGSENNDYTICDKPAEQLVIEKWGGQQRLNLFE